MTHAHNRQHQKQAIMGTISGLVAQLQQLAPHPDQPNYQGPLYLAKNPNFKAPDQHDGVLGSMMLEGMLGSAFAEAASEAVSDATGSEVAADMFDAFDMNAALEVYSEFITEIEQSKEDKAAHGQGTLARLSGKSISGSFNMRATISEGMQNFLEDLPKRMTIERSLAYYAKQLELLDAPSYELAAPKPRFAA